MSRARSSYRVAARVRFPAVLLLLTVLLGACSSLPESGPVHRDSRSDADPGADAARFTAPGPGRGDAPIQIVNGFLTAMTANPAATSAARSFLSRQARADWNPATSTLVYRSSRVTAGAGSTVDTVLSDPRRLDSRGGWLGDAGAGAGRLSLDMVRERGEWRIANPPDALLVPEYFLVQEYQPYSLYFFDPTERVLVPDRVYVPRGEQTASQLVRALLDGPGSALAGVVRTEFPVRTQLDLSVSVSAEGVAEVPLSRALLGLSPAELRRAAAQLSWTLRQVPGISRIRLAVDNTLVPLSGGRDLGADAVQAFAPTVSGAPEQLFTLAKGRLATLAPVGSNPAAARAVTGPFGRTGFALRSVGVSLDGATVSAVTTDGRTVLRTGVARAEPKGAAPQRVYSGTDVLPPAYDATGALWLVDRTPSGARVLEVTGGTAREVAVPGITGLAVKAFVVNRSGTALVAIIGGGGRADSVVSSDLLRSADGAVRGATRARANTALPSGSGPLVALAWTSPADVAVLGHPAKDLSRISVLSLDGSPGDPLAVPPDTWAGTATGLVGAPDRSETLYLVTQEGRLRALDASGLWSRTGVAAGQVSPTYVG